MQFPSYNDIPKKMGNRESKLWASAIVARRKLDLAAAEFSAACKRLPQ